VPRWLKEALIAFALVAVLAVVISKGVQQAGGGLERARRAAEAEPLDYPAQSFKLPARGGGEVDLSSLHGKPVLINFWATWCPPCREEMPSLGRLGQQFETSSFEIVAVSVDEGGWPAIDQFLAKPKTPYRVALDQGGAISTSYGTTKLPESYLVDKDGHVRLKFVGPRNWLDPNIVTLLESFGAKPKT